MKDMHQRSKQHEESAHTARQRLICNTTDSPRRDDAKLYDALFHTGGGISGGTVWITADTIDCTKPAPAIQLGCMMEL